MENEYRARAEVNGTDTAAVMAAVNGMDTAAVMAVVIGMDTVAVMAVVIGNTGIGFHVVEEYGFPDLGGLGFVGGEKDSLWLSLFCFFFVLSINSNYQYAIPSSPSEVQITANLFRQLVAFPDFNKIIRTH